MEKANPEKVYEVIKAIHQAASEGKDVQGAEKIGLKREVDVEFPYYGYRTMDGFGVKISGKIMRVSYHCITEMRDMEKDKIEHDITNIFKKILSFLTKQSSKHFEGKISFKEVKKESKKKGDDIGKDNLSIRVEHVSMRHVDIKAYKDYVINNLESKADMKEQMVDLPGNIDEFKREGLAEFFKSKRVW